MEEMWSPVWTLEGLPHWGGLSVPEPEASWVIAGLPCDAAATYRRGAWLASSMLRQLSGVLPPVSEKGALIQARVHDLGDFELPGLVEQWWPAAAERLALVPASKRLLALGGDHTTAIPVVAAQMRRHPELRLIWVDAHPDLCDFSRGSAYSCGCALRRAVELSGLDPRRVLILGARDFDYEEIEYAVSAGIQIVTTAELVDDPDTLTVVLNRFLGSANHPVHVSLDIDVLDPAFAPGTEVPSAGGLSTRQALAILRQIGASSNLVGMDLMEFCPPEDHSDITALAALKLIFETLHRNP